MRQFFTALYYQLCQATVLALALLNVANADDKTTETGPAIATVTAPYIELHTGPAATTPYFMSPSAAKPLKCYSSALTGIKCATLAAKKAGFTWTRWR